MTFISMLSILLGYGLVFGTMLLARLDYRRVRQSEDWDAR